MYLFLQLLSVLAYDDWFAAYRRIQRFCFKLFYLRPESANLKKKYEIKYRRRYVLNIKTMQTPSRLRYVVVPEYDKNWPLVTEAPEALG